MPIPNRCPWAGTDPVYVAYHDHEWGVPLHDDRRLFEAIVLDGVQAGLSWITILKKRAHYRRVFDDFDAHRMSRYGDAKIRQLMDDPGIVRNRRKIQAAVQNARAYLNIVDQFDSFDRYIWQFVGGRPQQNAWRRMADVPTESAASRAMSKDLKQRGFSFVGPTICYAFMQATGMINDHLVDCVRYKPVAAMGQGGTAKGRGRPSQR